MKLPYYQGPYTWVQQFNQLRSLPCPKITYWLTKPHCISEILAKYCHQLTVQVVSWGKAPVLPEEKQRLGMITESAMIRQVFLWGDKTPWTFGRLIVPENTYTQFAEQFDNLGDKLLGETLLHNNKAVTRSAFDYAQIQPDVWARRSVFLMENAPMLLIEAFLPAIPLVHYSA
jgi:chorismate lyase